MVSLIASANMLDRKRVWEILLSSSVIAVGRDFCVAAVAMTLQKFCTMHGANCMCLAQLLTVVVQTSSGNKRKAKRSLTEVSITLPSLESFQMCIMGWRVRKAGSLGIFFLHFR
eukprot:6153623-Amphidinium_carterae.1